MMDGILSPVVEFGRRHSTVAGIASVTLAVVATSYLFNGKKTTKEPPHLPETIPFVTNSVQVVTNMRGFCSRARFVQGLLVPSELYQVS
jgi:hypothetical protein